jgi:hypothetical protein
MTVWVFRQEREDHVERLFKEIRRGRLRQGWGYRPEFDLHRPRAKWMSAFERWPDERRSDPKDAYEKLAGMIEIEPGNLLIVPNQPDDRSFTQLRAVAAPDPRPTEGGAAASCYAFIDPLDDDFRHCIYVDPGTMRTFRYDDGRASRILAAVARFRAWRSPVQRVRQADVARALLRLFDGDVAPSAPRDWNGPHERGTADVFRPKDDSDYVVHVAGGARVQKRAHETLVRRVGSCFRRRSKEVYTPHPKDLEVHAPLDRPVIFEAKLRGGGLASPIREALGQLHWYRYHLGPRDAELCVVLDSRPPHGIVEFLEEGCGVLVAWWENDRVCGGPRAVERLAAIGVCDPP